MMSIERVKTTGNEDNQRCYTVDEALKEGEYLDGVIPSLRVIFAARNEVLDLSETMVPVIDQSVEVQLTGCVPEHKSEFSSIRMTIGECPQDIESRCGNCILSIVGGHEMLDSLRPLETDANTQLSFFA